MFPNLFEATKEYWSNLDRLEAAYKQGDLSLDEVDAKVAELMAGLAQERRDALTYLGRSLWYGLTARREILLGVGFVAIVAYSWMLTSLSS
ncbi:MAG: hypothetical protein QNJ46_08735 [Leptolyngbyaceae cyanobacterium MO_188.B28]|nr:hypothetical protein [Leptolyngbyaceae cyanobacterium MO_188.B28]